MDKEQCVKTIRDIPLAAPYYIGYSAGLDVLYSHSTEDAFPVQQLLHEQINNDMSTLDIQLYTHDGEHSATLYSSLSGGWPQFVRKIDNKIWFSYTGGAGSGYYSLPWDATLDTYPEVAATAEVLKEYNWEADQDPAGRIFIAGATSMNGGHTIDYVDEIHNNAVITVVNIGGNSSGFAFDREGNLWSGEYVLGYNPTMHIKPCRLGMWAKADVDAAIAGGIPLEWSDAAFVLPLGSTDITGETTNWGPGDIETDGQGHIYITMNTYQSWGYLYTSGRTVMLSPDGHGGYTLTELGTTRPRTGSDEWDWARTIAFDEGAWGAPTTDSLFVDMDMGTFTYDTDHVTAMSFESDRLACGIPSAPSIFVGDPINISTGNYYTVNVDIGPGPTPHPLRFIRYYNSRDCGERDMGHGWTHTYSRRLDFDTGLILARRHTGRSITYFPSDLQPRSAAKEQLAHYPDGSYTLTTPDQFVETYDETGKLRHITDPNGSVITLSYNGEQLSCVTDHFGRTLQFTHDAEGRIRSVTDPASNVMRYDYAEQAPVRYRTGRDVRHGENHILRLRCAGPSDFPDGRGFFGRRGGQPFDGDDL